MGEYDKIQKKHENRAVANIQKKSQNQAINGTQDNSFIAHGKECGCSSCKSQSIQQKILQYNHDVRQLTCDEGHPNHPAGPCRMANPADWDKKRAGQSHKLHDKDKGGRAKKYKRWEESKKKNEDKK